MKRDYIVKSNIVLYSPIDKNKNLYLADCVEDISYAPQIKNLLDIHNSELEIDQTIQIAAEESVSKFEKLVNSSVIKLVYGHGEVFYIDNNDPEDHKFIQIDMKTIKYFRYEDGNLYISIRFDIIDKKLLDYIKYNNVVEFISLYNWYFLVQDKTEWVNCPDDYYPEFLEFADTNEEDEKADRYIWNRLMNWK